MVLIYLVNVNYVNSYIKGYGSFGQAKGFFLITNIAILACLEVNFLFLFLIFLIGLLVLFPIFEWCA
jgi:hypothetical protein